MKRERNPLTITHRVCVTLSQVAQTVWWYLMTWGWWWCLAMMRWWWQGWCVCVILCHASNQIVSMCDNDENLDDALCDFVSDHSDSLMRQKWGSVWETGCSKQTSTFCPLFKQSPRVACTFDCLQQSKCYTFVCFRAFFILPKQQQCLSHIGLDPRCILLAEKI